MELTDLFDRATAWTASRVDGAAGMLDGRISDGDRGPGKSFAPAIAVPDDAQLQDKLLAYCGRSPGR